MAPSWPRLFWKLQQVLAPRCPRPLGESALWILGPGCRGGNTFALSLQEPDTPSKCKSSSSSTSSTSSSSSSDEEDDSDLDAKRGPRGRETHPVPQKKAQILVAKPELKDPTRKKRGRKPLPPEQKAARRPVSLARVLKTARKDLGAPAGKLPPPLSAPVAGLAALKAHAKEACGGPSTMATPENLASLVKGMAGSPSRGGIAGRAPSCIT